VGPDPGTLTVDLPEDLAAPDGAPYLRSLERGYAVDALVLRWIAMLAERGGPAAALDAIHRYETFGWITADVRDDLREYLSAPGLEDGRVDVDAARLAVEDHVASFRFVLALAVLERRRGEY
jgi:archaellum component FlaD/FlaE